MYGSTSVGIFCEEEKGDTEKHGPTEVEMLCREGKGKIKNHKLTDIKKYYRKGATGIVIFDPPKEGTDVLILEHWVDERKKSENNIFKLEDGYDRTCIIYHVEKPIIYDNNYYNPNNKAVLSYQVNRSSRRERRLDFRSFFCGYNFARELTSEDIAVVQQFRRLVDESFDIKRF